MVSRTLNKNIMNLKRILKVFILFLLPGILFAQETKQTMCPFNQLKISVTPALCNSLAVTNAGGADIFKRSPSFGAEATISYYQRIVKEFGVSLGVGINSTPYSFKFSLIPNVTNPEDPNYQKVLKEKRYEPVGMLTVPLAFSIAIPLKSSPWGIDIQAGVKFNYLFGSGTELLIADWWGPTSAFEVIKENSHYWVEVKRDKEVAFSYFLKAGATYATKRNNGYFVNIVANYSPQTILEGNYMLHAVNGDSYGSFKHKINYFGLEVGYALTLCKK
jgi:hypothetical protein